jgi:hypothetical protein
MYGQESNINEKRRFIIMNSTLNYILKRFKLKDEKLQMLPVILKNFTREDFAQMTSTLDFKVGVEIGVAEGKFSESLLVLNPSLTLYSIDPYISSEKNVWSPSKIKRYETEADARLQKHKRCIQLKNTSHLMAEEFSHLKIWDLDFVYVDGNHHYEYALQDMEDWWKLLKPGGILAGHDYEKYRFPHSKYWDVIGAVHTFVEKENISPWFIFGRKKNDKIYENCPKSWMMVKP